MAAIGQEEKISYEKETIVLTYRCYRPSFTSVLSCRHGFSAWRFELGI